jgi:branched-chain amino acid transport system permease protein
MSLNEKPSNRFWTAERAAVAGVIVIWLALPLVLADYTLYRVSQAGVFALAIVGLNLLIGQSGQLSIGHSAFFALGAYITALTMGEGGQYAYLSLPFAGVCCFIAGFLFGWPAMRLSNVHLLLATWGLALALPQLMKSSHLEKWTGGTMGIYLEKPDTPFGLPLSSDQWWHYVTLVVLCLLLPAAHGIARGRVGRALRSIRDHPQAAAGMGINVPLYKATIFGVSALYAGVAGGLAGLLSDFVAPGTYDIFFAMLLLVGAVVSGLGGIWTALLGGLMIEFLPDVSGALTSGKLSPVLVYGLILIAMIYLLPQGLAGAWQKWRQRP